MAINVVAISGNVGADPVIRTTGNGKSICNFSICSNKSRNVEGTWEDVPHWFDVVFFGKICNVIERHVHKGAKVAIRGELSQNRWETRDGQKRSKVEIIGHDIEFLNRSNNGNDSGLPPAEPGNEADAYYSEDIPFS